MERQELALRRWLDEHKEYELVESLVDAGVSAGKGKHRKSGALSRFLEMGRKGVIPVGTCLVVENVSRFTREASTDSLLSLISGIFQPDLAIAFVNYDGGNVIDGPRWNRQAGLKFGLMAAMDSARAEWEERASRSQGAARKRERLQDEGRRTDGRTPYWIARNPLTGQLLRDDQDGFVLEDHYAKALRRAVELALAGSGMKRIAAQLTAEGFSPPPTRVSNQWQTLEPAERKAWTPGVVSQLLSSPALVGTLCRDAGDLPGYYPAVVDQATFARLRKAVEGRDCLRAVGRGNSRCARNLFQGMSRCAVCDGPISFSKPARHARPNHPGYVQCAAGAGSQRTCPNRGTVRADHWHAHCLTRLSRTVWEELLKRPEEAQERTELERRDNELKSLEIDLRPRLERAQRRAEELSAWESPGDETDYRLAKGNYRRLETEMDQLLREKAEVARDLEIVKARPSSEAEARQLSERVRGFWEAIDEVTGEERVSFNRWLLSREPAIVFRLHSPAGEAGKHQIELLVGSKSLGLQPVAPLARQQARVLGFVDPVIAKDVDTSRGKRAVVVSVQQVKLSPEELDTWPIGSAQQDLQGALQ
jgi:hypothetical protein